jgi:hypothetical protein
MSTRTADKRKPSRQVRDILSSFIETLEDDVNVSNEAICNAVEASLDPPNYTGAMKTPTTEQWKIAIENELQSLRDNRTWTIVNKPDEVKPLHSRDLAFFHVNSIFFGIRISTFLEFNVNQSNDRTSVYDWVRYTI